MAKRPNEHPAKADPADLSEVVDLLRQIKLLLIAFAPDHIRLKWERMSNDKRNDSDAKG